MEKEHLNLLTLTEYFLVKSTKTSKPYADEEGNCHLFEVKSDAEVYTDALDGTEIEKAKTYRKQFVMEVYSYGFTGIIIKKRNKPPVKIPIGKTDVGRIYVNADASYNVMMLRQTSKMKYARELRKVNFITPILIDPRFVKRYPEMHYSYACTEKDEKFYILFTTLKEFEEWKKDQEQDWKPVEMKLQKVGRIRKNDNVLINPLSDKLILQDKQIAEILKG